MNTCLQNLIHSEDFIRRLLAKEESIGKYTPITLKFLNLCKEMEYASGRSVTPSEFKQKFGSKHSLFRGYGQNDTQEFCRILLEDMNRELNEVKHKAPYKELSTVNKEKIVCDREFDELFRSRESSIILDSFYGQIINIFTCRCKFKTYSFQKVLDLPLLLQSINSSVSIDQLLDSYFQGEDIQFETKCESCGKKTVHKKEIRISQPPNILILSLQRINPRTQRKNTCSVSFKENLDISRYIDPECGHSNEYRYSLYGIGNHSGSINFGHYYAYIKLNNSNWYEFNDSYVSQMGRISTSSTTAYTLFYKKNI
jgi:ubiquitin C-terminal hydrolase